MACYVEVQDAPAIMANNEEAVEKTEGDRRNGEEIHGGDGFTMMRRKAKHRRPGSGSLGARFIQREMLRSDTSKPSIRSSPWMRGAPQVGFSATTLKIKSFTSFESLFLPTRFLTLEIKLQYRRKPALCQRTTVSGVTTMRDCFHPDQNRRVTTQKSMSSMRSLGLGCLRFSTVRCCRRAKFSRSKLRRERKMRTSIPNQRQDQRDMDESYSG